MNIPSGEPRRLSFPIIGVLAFVAFDVDCVTLRSYRVRFIINDVPLIEMALSLIIRRPSRKERISINKNILKGEGGDPSIYLSILHFFPGNSVASSPLIEVQIMHLYTCNYTRVCI